MAGQFLHPRLISILRRISDSETADASDGPIDPRVGEDVNQLVQLGLLVKSPSKGWFVVSDEGEQYLMAVDARERGEI